MNLPCPSDMKSKVTPFKLMSILPTNKTFYRYNGSLTTPKCQESVNWTDFDNAIEISKPQVNRETVSRLI